MLRHIRESLALVLLIVLPFHALLVTAGTKMMIGPDHTPVAALALWKEALLLLILGVAFLECVLVSRKQLAIGNSPLAMRPDAIDLLILALVLLALFMRPSPAAGGLAAFLYGFKYDLLPLVAFLLLRRVPWSDRWQLAIGNWLLAGGLIIALYGMMTLYLPDAWFRFLGYSDLHSIYNPDSPIAAFQYIGESGIRRIQSVMSGPNQLGLWLLLPWTMGLKNLLSLFKREDSGEGSRGIHPRPSPLPRGAKERGFFLWLLLDIALFLTYSRAAWIAAVVIAVMLILRQWPYAWRGIVPAILAIVFLALLWKPSILVRFASSRDHLLRPVAAMRTIADHPLGLGLGSAGPASNRFSDVCVFLEAESNTDWALPHQDLCVFVGGTQVQPVDHPCMCPVIPENWYLQIGIELGILGFLMYILLVVLLLRRLLWDKGQGTTDNNAVSHVSCPLSLFMLGLSIAALFLHSFEDSAVAYTAWILAAAMLPVVMPRRGA